MILLKCKKCNQESQYNWSFDNNNLLYTNGCKRCSGIFHIDENSQELMKILPKTQLPYHDAFYCNDSDGNFYYHHLPEEKKIGPVLWAQQFMRFHDFEGKLCDHIVEGIVPLEEIEKFLNTYGNNFVIQNNL